MAAKLWRVALNLTPAEKQDYEFYRAKNRLTDSNAKVLKRLALQSIYGSVNHDTKRVVITDKNAEELRTLLREVINVSNDVLFTVKHSQRPASGYDQNVINALQSIQKAVTERWQSLL